MGGTADSDPDADLSAALDGLMRITMGAQSLEQSLTWIATLAVLAIPGAQGAGITMLEEGRSQTVCASHDFVRQVDDIQYSLGEGPCITAAAEARTVRSGALGSDPSWPRFGRRVQRLGVNSVVSLPLAVAGGDVQGAVNVYSHQPDAFTAAAAEHGEAFAVPAAVAVVNARGLMQSHRLSEQLQAALTHRATIDQAIGIVLSRQGGTPDEAFATLKRLSQTQNVKLAAVAAAIVQEAISRARARHIR